MIVNLSAAVHSKSPVLALGGGKGGFDNAFLKVEETVSGAGQSDMAQAIRRFGECKPEPSGDRPIYLVVLRSTLDLQSP